MSSPSVVLQVRRHCCLVMCVPGSQIAMQSFMRCSGEGSRLMLPVVVVVDGVVAAGLLAVVLGPGSASTEALISKAPAMANMPVLAILLILLSVVCQGEQRAATPCEPS